MKVARITIFAGHYGSGKTNLAINYAIWLKAQVPRVTLCDLDIVNPYFRTADAMTILDAHGISLIASPFANTNVDAPALPAATRAIFDDQGTHAVIDLGGDDRGALALGRYASMIRADNYEMLLVFNPFRPLTRDLSGLREIRQEIETAARVPFTGLVNNANLGGETSLEDVVSSIPGVQTIADQLDLPLRFTAVWNALLPPPDSAERVALAEAGALFPVQRFGKTIWKL